MPWRLIAVTAIFLLVVAAGSISLADAARRVPWDCSNWTAFVHDDRTTAILETLAENRGQALYCGIDQSDTFTKAETWEAGRDRNERDDTVYFGENGNFRGFIAAQEGWLTEGESGITGQSTATIFEFPRSGRRVIRVKRRSLATESPSSWNTVSSCQDATPPGDLLCSGWTTDPGQHNQNQLSQSDFSTTPWQQPRREWNTSRGISVRNWNEVIPDTFQGLANQVARRKCGDLGSGWRLGRATVGPSHDERKAVSDNGLGWIYEDTDASSGVVKHRVRQSRTWTATCVKKTRRTR